MSKAMRTVRRNAETTLLHQRAKRLRDGRRFQCPNRRTHSQKDPSIRLGRWSPLQMLDDRGGNFVRQRSEEHTSELQSQSNLVCRLLLEKKKNKKGPECLRTRLCHDP